MRLSPRPFIYVIAALACAWFIHRHSPSRQNAGQGVSDAASDPTSPPVRLAPVVKDASLGNPSTKRLPMLVILSDNESTLPTDDLRGRLREFCNVIHVETTDDTQQHFKADRIPVAILFNADSEEIGRREHPWTIKDLETLARSVSTKAEATPQALHEPTNAQPAEPAIP